MKFSYMAPVLLIFSLSVQANSTLLRLLDEKVDRVILKSRVSYTPQEIKKVYSRIRGNEDLSGIDSIELYDGTTITKKEIRSVESYDGRDFMQMAKSGGQDSGGG
ncbi:MAG: hypothetical protein HOE90_05995 [Bacteriovoracaceae bacterium]|jgi:hypothetical protein|nr:hypothetical protein [Bacteriovoracaceae bacterium]